VGSPLSGYGEATTSVYSRPVREVERITFADVAL
jgi:hypothetical protein